MKRSAHPVDDLFRESLQEHQIRPSDAGRRRFLREASTIKIRGRSRRSRWLLVLIGLVVVISAALLLWIPVQEEERSEDVKPIATSGQWAVGSGQVADESRAEAESPQPTTTDQGYAPEKPEIITEQVPESGFIPEQSFEKPAQDTVTNPVPVAPEEFSKRVKRTWEWQFAVSTYYAPEWMFSTLEGEKYVNNIGVEGTFRYGRYSVRTGIGLSVTKGTNELLVEYNDYLGSFNQLDSIRFHWDERNYHLLPTYYTSPKDVWDSLMQQDHPRVIKRYTYLQIPLILGYDVIQARWVSLGFRAGPVLSILARSKQLSDEYDPGKNRIIRVNQATPDRIQINWQIQGGINASFRLSKRIRLDLEPNIKYYFNSVYEQSDVTKKPWSAGFRTAITILF